MDISKKGKVSQKFEGDTSSKIVAHAPGNKTNTDDKRVKMETVDVDTNSQSSKLKDVEEVLINKINKRSDGYIQKLNKSNQKIEKPKEFFRETEKKEVTMDEDFGASKKLCNSTKAATKDNLKIFTKRVGTGGISGQLYEIYLVILILLNGLTNKNITQFHLASNLVEAGDFDDVVCSYTYKDINAVEKIKVTFLQAKYKEKRKYISLEELLGKSGKGGFDLKKYFKSFCNIKKNFERGNSSDPIFGSDFNECDFIIYTNSIFRIGYTEKVYIKELLAEEDWILNVNGERIKYYQLRFSENKNDRIKTFLGDFEESEEKEFKEFLSKLKICTAQPNHDQLEEVIKENIQFHYGITRSDNEIVFRVVKNKIEAWWKTSSEYLTEKNTFIQNAARHSIRFEVQDPVPGFTGREQSLRDLHKALQSSGYSVITQAASITGLGGIGKTELARQYVSQYSLYYDNNVIWINAENYVTCSESFRRLAGDKLEIDIKNKDGNDKDITSITSEVYAFFTKRNKKSLFIFDNAENVQDGATAKEEENVTNFLPSGDNKPYIIITSRNQQWRGILSLQLDLFTKEESAQFIIEYLSRHRIECEENEIKILGEILQYLPLALRHAVAYVAMENKRLQKRNKSYTIENYLKEFEDKKIELLGKDSQDMFDTYDKTVLTTWQVTIEKIKQNEIYGMQAELILNIIAFFAPGNIPIITIFGSLMGNENVRGCIEILECYSLVKLQGEELSIHLLLQQVIRIMLQKEGKDIEIIERTLCLFNEDIRSNCIMHLRFVWDYAKNLNKVVENFSWVPLLITKKLVEAIKYTEAYSFMMVTYKLFNDVLGDIHPDTVMSLQWIVEILTRQRKYNEAVLVCQELLHKRNKMLGQDHTNTLGTMRSLASLLDTQGKYEEALILYKEVLCKQRKILGLGHLNTLATMHSLASVYGKQGKYEESSNLYKEVLCKLKDILGPDHPDTLVTLHNFASVLNEQGKYKESLSIHQEVLCKQKECLGPNHPNTLITMQNLASVLDNLGKYEESLILYQKVLCEQKEIFGPNHSITLNTIYNIASLLDKQGKYKESLTLYQEVFSKQTEILGIDHPKTLNPMHNLTSASPKNRFKRFVNIILKRPH